MWLAKTPNAAKDLIARHALGSQAGNLKHFSLGHFEGATAPGRQAAPCVPWCGKYRCLLPNLELNLLPGICSRCPVRQRLRFRFVKVAPLLRRSLESGLQRVWTGQGELQVPGVTRRLGSP